jgi:RHS repeat-associated protein/uncharacterized repeat protein (TIGR01451 family)
LISRLLVLSLVAAVLTVLPASAVRPVAAQVDAGFGEAYSQEVLADNPWGYWRLEEEGSVFSDELGLHDMVASGGFSREDGVRGQALLMRGGALEVLGGGAFRPAETLSVEFWLRGSEFVSGTAARWHAFGWGIGYGGGSMSASVSRNGAGAVGVGTSGVAVDEWHHVVLVKEQTAVRLYVDGEEADSVENVSGTVRYCCESTLTFAADKAFGGYRSQLPADFDEIAVYETPLTPERVRDHFCAGGGESLACPVEIDLDAGPDQSVAEGDVVALAGSANPRVNPVVEWQVVSSEGPPVQLLGADTLSPSFLALDDGVYTFRVTATSGDQVVSDEVTVTVGNADPVIGVDSQPTSEDGLIMVTTSFTDAGIADSHTATFDWGDGTTSDGVTGVPGTGWGAISAAHVYDSPGTYTVGVTVTDDDGGTALSSVEIVIENGGVPQPVSGVAIWGDDPDAKEAVKISGGRHQIMGLLHSNSAFVNSGNDSVFTGGTQFVDGEKSKPKTESNVYDPAPVVVDVRNRPVSFDVADYQPGGSAAVAAGDQFFDLSEFCGPDQGETWKPETALAVGLYWVPCKKVEFQNDVTTLGPVTIVTTGEIKSPAGERFFGAPFVDNLLLLTTREDTAIDINNGGSVFGGFVVSQNGKIKINGGGHRFQCGVLGELVEVTGGDHVFDATQCGSIDDSGGLSDGIDVAAPPVVVPALVLQADADPTVSPGVSYQVEASVVNTGVELTVPGLVALANRSGSDVEVSGVEFALERFDVADDAWLPFASSATGEIDLAVTAAEQTGVVYGPDGAIAGTVVAEGSEGLWSVLASTTLSSAQLDLITDPAVTAGLRSRIDLDTGDQLVLGIRQTTRLGGDLVEAITTAGTDASDVTLSVASGDGQPAPAGPTLLANGTALDSGFGLTSPTLAARGEFEPEPAYLARLQEANGQTQGALTSSSGTAPIGPVYAPTVITTTAVTVPVVRAAAPATVPAVAAGEQFDWSITLSNTGDAVAVPTVTGTVFDQPMTVSNLPTELAPGATAEIALGSVVPVGQTGTFTADAVITWTDTAGNVYGTLDRTTRGGVVIPTVLDVDKTAATEIDGTDVRIRYVITVTNTGNDPVTGVAIADSLDTGLTITDDVSVTQGTLTVDGTAVSADIGTVEPGQTVTMVVVAAAASLPAGQVRVENQATVTSNELPSVFSDDPAVPGDADPTVFTFDEAPGNGGSGTITGIGDVTGPNATDIQPAAGTEVTEPTDITTTFELTEGRTLAEYTVSVYPAGGDPDAATVLAEGTADPAGGVIGTIDPTILSNGVQIIRIVATDDAGATRVTESPVVIDGNLKLGRFALTYEDMAVNVGGLPVRVLRSYDTLDRAQSDDFGFGWDLEIANITAQRSHDPLGFGPWDGVSCGGGFLFTDICYTAANDNRFVTVTWPNGETESFDLTAKGNTFFPILVTFAYESRGNATSTLTPVGSDATGGFANGSMTRGGFGDGGVYNPTRFELTDRFGTVYLLDINDGVQEMTDRNGNTVTVTDAGITSSQGPSITFERDGQGRITTATGPDGESVTYSYDAAGDLTTATDQNSAVYGFDYDTSHYLTGIDDPGPGPRQVLTYTNDGRLESVTDAEGNTTQITVDPDARTEIVTSPDGRLVTISQFDDRGNAVTVDEVYDGESHVSSFVFNDDDLVTSRTDPEGNTWTGVYDDDRNLTSFTDAENNTSAFTYDAFGFPTSVTDAEGNTTSFVYDSAGNLTSITDPRGGTQTFTYDGRGNQLTRTDQIGRVWEWSYTTEDRVQTATDPRGNVTGYAYDGQGRVTTITAADGGETGYTYDDVGNLTTVTDPLGRTTAYTYDSRDRLTTSTDAAGFATTYSYNDNDRLTSRTDPTGRTWDYTYTFDRLIAETAPDGGITAYGYDGAGRVETMTDPLGRTTTYAYDGANRRTTVTSPIDDGGTATTATTLDGNGRTATVTNAEGETTNYTYDGLGRLTSRTDGLGRTTNYSFDEVGNRTSVTNAENETVTSAFDLANQLESVTNALNETTGYTYDPAGNLATVTDPLGRTTGYSYELVNRQNGVTLPSGDSSSMVYDTAGQVLTSTSAAGYPTSFTYDPRGLVATVADGLGNTTTTAYDQAGRRTSVTDARGNTTSYTYDPVGRLETETDPLGGTVTFGYDLAGQRVSVTDPNGATRTSGYDDGGRMIIASDALGRSTTYGYDAVGRQTLMTDARGVTVQSVFDAAGQLAGQTSPNETRSFSYDGAGRMTAWTDQTGTTTQTFDDAGRLTSVAAPAGTVGYSYNAVGERTGMSQSEGTVAYTYDPNGYQATVTDWQSGTVTIDNDPDGRIQGVSRSNGVDTVHGFDGAGRLTSIAHSGPAGPIDSFDYLLDPNGNRTAVTSTTGVESYTLDALNRLTGVSYPDATSEAFVYDAASNRTSHTKTDGTTVGYTVDAVGQLVSDTDGVAYTYDAAGNLTATSSGFSYTYDDYGRMVAATADGVSQTYVYDAADVRTGVDGQGQVWDRNGLPTLISDGADTYLHTGAGATRTGTSWHLADALGSVRNTTDNAGAVTASQSYTAFGERLTGTSEFGYAGQQHDPTGLQHLRARQYQPALGRFTAVDHVQPGASGTPGWNLYGYAGSNPTTFADPSGQVALAGYLTSAEIAAVALVAGVTVTVYVPWVLCLQGRGGCASIEIPWSVPDPFGGSAPPVPPEAGAVAASQLSGAGRGDPHGSTSKVPGLERQIAEAEAELAELIQNQGSKKDKNRLRKKIKNLREQIGRVVKGETHGRTGF